jgi:hypothetical protein
MHPRFRNTIAYLLLALATVGYSFAIEPAKNPESSKRKPDVIVPFYTGSWTGAIDGGLGGGGVDGEFAGGNPGGLEFLFTYDGVVANLHPTGRCAACSGTYYQGQINSGSVSFNGQDESGQNPPYGFTGAVLPGGTFSEHSTCYEGQCDTDYIASFSFQGAQQPNGWYSTGSMDIMGSCEGGDCGGGSGQLSLQTFAPGSDIPVSTMVVPNVHVERVSDGFAFTVKVPEVAFTIGPG